MQKVVAMISDISTAVPRRRGGCKMKGHKVHIKAVQGDET